MEDSVDSAAFKESDDIHQSLGLRSFSGVCTGRCRRYLTVQSTSSALHVVDVHTFLLSSYMWDLRNTRSGLERWLSG